MFAFHIDCVRKIQFTQYSSEFTYTSGVLSVSTQLTNSALRRPIPPHMSKRKEFLAMVNLVLGTSNSTPDVQTHSLQRSILH